MIPCLLSAGANVNAQDCCKLTSLHLAASKGCVQCTTQLLKAGANVLMVCHQGYTPIQSAYLAGHIVISRYLESHYQYSSIKLPPNTLAHALSTKDEQHPLSRSTERTIFNLYPLSNQQTSMRPEDSDKPMKEDPLQMPPSRRL